MPNSFGIILCWIYPVFAKFNGSYFGKATPIHLFWHSMDFVLTFFSGNAGPDTSKMDPVSKEAYSHEVISFGFWAGDSNLHEPAFYSYTYPEPKNLGEQPLQPSDANWITANGTSMALLKYHDLINESDPESALMAFLKSAYEAGMTLTGSFPELHS